jgi:amino acid adenylation domain-containing protein
MDGSASRQEVNPSIRLLSWSGQDADTSGKSPEINIIDADLSYILFTSGSTGNPKGVMLSHLNALTFINMACDFFKITKEDVLSNVSPLHFDLSVFDIYVAFKAAATVAIVPDGVSMFPSKLAEFIQNNKITVWNSVPSALSLLANYANLNTFDFSSLRLVLFAGEVFPVKYLRQLKKHTPAAKFYNIYGQTEANSSTYYLVDKVLDEDASLIPIGKAFPNFDIFALDENGKKITEGASKGELFVRAHTIAAGYWSEPEKTKEKFIRNPLDQESGEIVYRTGDIVRLDEQGDYVFLGRVDQMIKSRGYRIEIGEIEIVLSNHPQVKTAVVIPIPDDLIGNRIAAVIIPSNGSLINKEDILRHCAKQLPKYMVPETLEFKDSLPMTSSGKVDRKKLIELIQEHK